MLNENEKSIHFRRRVESRKKQELTSTQHIKSSARASVSRQARVVIWRKYQESIWTNSIRKTTPANKAKISIYLINPDAANAMEYSTI